MVHLPHRIMIGVLTLLFLLIAGCSDLTGGEGTAVIPKGTAVLPSAQDSPVPSSEAPSQRRPEASGLDLGISKEHTVSESEGLLSAASVPDAADDGPVIRIMAGDEEFTAVLYDNPAAWELVAMMPFTYTMEELNGNEKYYFMPNSFPVNAEQVGSVHAGDLMLYGSDCLVLFYGDFTSTYSYTRMGTVDDPAGLKAALGGGRVSVTFSVP